MCQCDDDSNGNDGDGKKVVGDSRKVSFCEEFDDNKDDNTARRERERERERERVI